MTIERQVCLLMFSKEFEHVGLSWRVDVGKDHTFYVKHVEIQVPTHTLHRKNATPAYVLRCEGQVQYHPEKQSLTIV